MPQLDSLKAAIRSESLPPDVRAEARLLLAIYEPREYRRKLAETLLERGMELLKQAA